MLSDKKEPGFRFYSLGIVVKDKEEGSDMITVTPIEDFPMEKGRLSDTDREKKTSTPDTNNVTKTTTAKGGSTVEAKWVALSNPNRDNPPDVYKSETVMLYKYADTQDYYWTSLFREPKLRRLERMRTTLSNKRGGVDAFDSDSSYWTEIDTKYKKLRLHTSDNDGEKAKYDITIDTKAGTFELIDSLGNKIYLDSVKGVMDVETNLEVNVKTQKYYVKASEIIFESNTLDIKTGTTTLQSNSIGVSGGGGGAQAELKGNFNVDGNISASGTIIDAGGNTNHHSH